MKERKVSEAVIHRLPKYYRYLEELQKRGVERISSGELSEEMGLNASQIRQDFNCFGGFGQQGYGYQVSSLLKELQGILGLVREYKVIVVGAGNIGRAISSYRGFAKDGFSIVAAFDINHDMVGQCIRDISIRDIAELDAFLQKEAIDVGVISTQKEDAQDICNKLVENGVKAIWNFAPVDVQHKDGFVENVHLSDFLYILTYRLNNQGNAS